MTVHAIEVVASPESNPLDPVEAREASVLAEVGVENLRLIDQACSIMLVADPTPHYRGLYRLDGALPLAAVLDAIEARLGDRTWYRCRTHRCSNDIPSPCEPWQVARTFGVVPEGV